ncbi:MAG: class I SAM-dependent methyltransferase [Methanobacterium sp.]
MGKYGFFSTYEYGVHQKIVDYVGQGKKVLDVGCAEGNLSQKMQENGCEVVGVELDERSAQMAQKYCHRIIIGDVEFIELNEEYKYYFDFILFADVLEHLRDPSHVLCKFKNYLKDDGKIIISLPNIANWRMRLNLLFGNFEYEESGLLDKSHLRFYNLKGVKKLLKDVDLELIELDVSLNGVTKFAKLCYLISLKWPNLFAYQFLLITKKK